MSILKEQIDIPIYEARIWLIVTDRLLEERKEPGWVHLFGKPDDEGHGEYSACVSYDESGTFGLFIDPLASQDINTVAHEVFHLTHRILEWTNCNFDSTHHEPGAMLNGYLMKLITERLAKVEVHI